MKHTIDARGLACPQPVILTRTGMKDHSEIEIIVDNETALENVKRLTESSGWDFEYSSSGDNFRINIRSKDIVSENLAGSKQTANSEKNDTIVVFSSDKMGSGDDDLGSILIKACINTITSLDTIPSKIIFYNSGVKLAAEESGVNDDLEFLHSKGTDILICGTCLNFYNISDKVKIGTISNMFDILTAMNNAANIIKP